MTFGENIANRRKENGLTQEQLAKQVCVSRPMIAQIERGSKAPHCSTRAAHCPRAELQPDGFGGGVKKKPPTEGGRWRGLNSKKAKTNNYLPFGRVYEQLPKRNRWLILIYISLAENDKI